MANILIVSTNRKLTNGASQCILNMAEGLRKYGHNPVVAVAKGPLQRELNKRGITCENILPGITLWKKPLKIQFNKKWKIALARLYFGIAYTKGLFPILRNLSIKYTNKRMGEIIDKHCIDLVHMNAVTSGFQAIEPLRRGLPLVWHIREFLEEDLKSTFISKKYSYRLMNRADAFIAISDAIKRKYERNIQVPIHRIYDGVDVNKFYEESHILQSRNIRLLVVGRITKAKGHLTVVEAVKILRSRGLNVSLDIYGSIDDIDYVESIKDFIDENDLSKVVNIKGFSSNLEKKMSGYDILCVASKKEGFGLVIIQAKLSGILVIGAASGATKELIENGETGLLYTYKGGSFALARQIEWAVNNKERAKLMAKEGQEKAYKNFSLEKSIDGILEVYNDLLD